MLEKWWLQANKQTEQSEDEGSSNAVDSDATQL